MKIINCLFSEGDIPFFHMQIHTHIYIHQAFQFLKELCINKVTRHILFLRYDVGDGTRMKFWEGAWCKDCSLKEAFPEFYLISRTWYSSIAEVMQYIGIHSFVVLSLGAQLVITILCLFMDLVYSTNVRVIGSYKACWKPAMSKGFEVQGYYLSLYPTFFFLGWNSLLFSLLYYYHIFSLENGVAIKGSS